MGPRATSYNMFPIKNLTWKIPIVLPLFLVIITHLSFADVRLPPKITVQPKEEILYVNDNEVLLECEAEGVPDVEYSWKKNGVDFNWNQLNVKRLNEKTGSFMFTPATSFDEGYYQCFASNTYGKALSLVAVLKRAVLAPYSPSETIDYKGNIGVPMKVVCQNTKSYPKPEYSWVVARDAADANFNVVSLSNRIQQDSDGNLYFSNLEKSDERGGYLYKCSVYNSYTELTTTGSYSKIIVQDGTLALARPVLHYRTKSPKKALVGGQVKLKCLFSGYPTPTISWTRKGGSLPIGRFEYGDFGTSLNIKDLRKEDEGTYVCTGSNSQDKVDEDVHLLIESVPKFGSIEKQPHNMNKSDGEEAVFHCDAEGLPTPTVVWYKNGEKLDSASPGPRLKVTNDGKTLTIINLCKNCATGLSDLMVIQCNSSNVNGYAYSEGYLNVLERTVMLTSPTDIEMVEWEDKVFFPCTAKADESTSVTYKWTHDDVEIDLSKPVYEVKDGGLHIYADKAGADGNKLAGKYTCTATNTYTIQSGSATLKVPVAPVPTPPPVVGAEFPMWIIYLLIGIVVFLFLIIIIVCLCCWCKKNKEVDYPVDEKERAAGRDPEKELLDNGFHDYQRQDNAPFKGSRASLTSTIKLNESDDDDDLAEYGEPDAGKFTEDGSFIGQYIDKQNRSRADDSIV